MSIISALRTCAFVNMNQNLFLYTINDKKENLRKLCHPDKHNRLTMGKLSYPLYNEHHYINPAWAPI